MAIAGTGTWDALTTSRCFGLSGAVGAIGTRAAWSPQPQRAAHAPVGDSQPQAPWPQQEAVLAGCSAVARCPAAASCWATARSWWQHAGAWLDATREHPQAAAGQETKACVSRTAAVNNEVSRLGMPRAMMHPSSV